jgi:hypothetical protein
MKKRSFLLIIIVLILFSFSGCKVSKDKIAKYSRDKKYDKIMSFINENYNDKSQNEVVVYSIDTILSSNNPEYIGSIEDLFYKDDAENLRISILKAFNDYGTAFKSSSRFLDFFIESHWEMDEIFEQASVKMIENYEDNIIYDYLKKQIEYCIEKDNFNRAKQIGQAFSAVKKEDKNLEILNELIDRLIENSSENKEEIKEEIIKFMDRFTNDGKESSNTDESSQSNGTDNSSGDNRNISSEDKLKQLIFDFNYAWVDYVNTGSKKVYNYIVPKGDIERIANNFDREDVKQRYIDIQVKNVEIEGNSAYLKVYERLNVNRKGKDYIKEYNWLYEAQKIDGEWLLRKYTKYNTNNNNESNSSNNQSNTEKSNSSNNKKVKFGFDSNIKYKYEDINNSKKISEDEKYEFGGEFYNYSEKATETLMNFNRGWLKYINDGDDKVFSYIVKDGECYNIAMKYKNKKLKERFLDMKIGEMRKGQEGIYVWCYEKIEEDVNGKKTVKEYHWIYKLKQNVMDYLVDSYIKDPAYN